METDPDAINDPRRSTIWKQGKIYAADNAESKERNESRAESREDIKSIGMIPNAFATAVKHVKDKSPRERKQWLDDYLLTIKVLGSAQQELFPNEALKAEKREADRKAKEAEERKAAKEAEAADAAGSRSDPKSGGAGGAKGRGKAKDKAAKPNGKPTTDPQPGEVAAGISAEPGAMTGTLEEQEAAEGDAALNAGLPQSQSAQAAAIRDKLGLNG